MEWMENLSDDLKNDEGLKKFENVAALATSYKSLESRVAGSIRVVGPDASAEDRAATYQKVMKHMPELMLKPDPESTEQMAEFHAMLGVPENAEGYVWDGEGLDDDTITELRSLAQKTNMTKKQFKAYVGLMSEMNGSTLQMKEDARVRMGAELKTTWGMAFEDRYAVVEKHLKENPDLGSIETMTPIQISAHYELAKALTGVPQLHDQPPKAGSLTPDEAQAQMTEIDNNPAYMSTNPADRLEHMRLIKKRHALSIVANPARYA